MSSRNSTPLLVVGFGLTLALRGAAPAAETPPAAASPGVVLLRSGRVIEGQIVETETHVVVIRPVGRIELRKEDCRAIGKDLEEVFRMRAAETNPADPDEHVRLAQWCLMVNLRAHAVAELERAAELAPNSKRVRGMLEAVRHAHAPAAAPDRAPDRSGSAAVASSPSEFVHAPRIDPPAAAVATFSLNIQPLLFRTCATAGCHGAGHDGPFVLQRVARVTPRVTQQNLRAVLALIDPDAPDQSPLLKQAAEPHGALARAPISAALHDAAYQTLVTWVDRVLGQTPTLAPAQEVPDTAEPLDEADTSPAVIDPAAAEPAPRLPGARADAGRGAAATTAPSARPGVAAAPPPSGPAARPVPRRPTASPIDPFDPEIFNAQFAP
jgi:hypothetical protein